jgi:hypothetical protein
MYQSSKSREETSGGGKGGTDVTLKRVYVNALIHLNDRETLGMLQLIGNGQLLLWNERNLIGVTSENLTADVYVNAVVVSLFDQIDPDFRDTFKVGDLVIPKDFVRVAGPNTWNGTYYEVTAVTGATPAAASTMTVVPIDGQSVAGLSYTGGTPFSPAAVRRLDDVIGGSTTTATVYIIGNNNPVTYIAIKNPGGVAPTQIFQAGDEVQVRNADYIAAGGANNSTRVGYVHRIVDGGLTALIKTQTPTLSGSPVSLNYYVPPLPGKKIILEFIAGTNFTTSIFPEGFDPIANYGGGHEDQGQPPVLVSDYGYGQTANYLGMATQGLVQCYVSAFGDQLPTNLEAIIEVDDALSWGQAVEAMLQRGGLVNTQISTSGVSQRPFRGAYVRGMGTVIQQLQPMLVAGQIVVQDRNGVVFLFEIDNADSVQIENGVTFSDFGARMYGAQPTHDKVQSDDKSESDMPTSIGIRFQDPDSSFSLGYEHFGLRNPGGTNHTNDQQINLSSMVLSRREARNLATTLMRRAYVNRRTYRMALPCAYLHLLENDMITWTDDDGEVITARIIQRDIGANFLINVTALREMTNLAVVGSPVQSSAQIIPQNVSSGVTVLTAAIDAPAIANSETTTPAVRLAVADMSGNLQTATVWESQAASSYQPIGTVGGTCALGYIITMLTAQTASEVFGTTVVSLRAQTCEVFWENVGSGVIESCTQAQAEAGQNWCSIFDQASPETEPEIAAFTTVTDNGGGIYTLGGWLRGLRGTPSGDRVNNILVLLNQSTAGIFLREFTGPTPTSLEYKVVPSGGNLATTTVTTVSSPKFRNVLPLPIRNVTKTYNATTLSTRFDVAEHWERQLLPLGTQPPHTLDEPFEAYRVYIYHKGQDSAADSYLMDSRRTGATTLRDTFFDWSNARAVAAGYTPGPSETYQIGYQQIGQWGEGPLRLETI